MCGVRKIISSFLASLLVLCLKRLPSTGMSPRIGILLSLEDLSFDNQAADDDRLSVRRDHHGIGGARVNHRRVHAGGDGFGLRRVNL